MSEYLVLGHKGYLGSYLSSNLNSDSIETRNISDNGKKYKFIIN